MITVQGAIDFFERGTKRVSSIAFYAEPIHLADNIAYQGHHTYEILNPRRRFGKELDWRFFTRWRPPQPKPPDKGSWTAMPPKYIRLFNFPKGLADYAEK
jgi:hypothetical protein